MDSFRNKLLFYFLCNSEKVNRMEDLKWNPHNSNKCGIEKWGSKCISCDIDGFIFGLQKSSQQGCNHRNKNNFADSHSLQHTMGDNVLRSAQGSLGAQIFGTQKCKQHSTGTGSSCLKTNDLHSYISNFEFIKILWIRKRMPKIWFSHFGDQIKWLILCVMIILIVVIHQTCQL